MQDAKIRLSPEESALILEAGWILTKRSIQEKVVLLMQALARDYAGRSRAWNGWPEVLLTRPPKISKGENYKGLPYCILDFPAYFDREHVFAIRTLFWWGHYFSLTLHLKGRYKEAFLPLIFPGLTRLGHGWQVALGPEEWAHAVTAEHYQPVDAIRPDTGDMLAGQPHFKLACTHPLEDWDRMPTILGEDFDLLMEILGRGGDPQERVQG